MIGYDITYIDLEGHTCHTWLSKPISNVFCSSPVYFVRQIFSVSHSGCKIINIVLCTLEKFNEIYS